MSAFATSRGRPLPLGSSRAPGAVNFAVISRHAESVTLVILPEAGGSRPMAEIPLDRKAHRTGDHWHIRVEGLPELFCYGFRVSGPKGPMNRFDPTRLLIDPCATAISNGADWASTCEVDPERTSRRSLYVRSGPYDWGTDAQLHTKPEDSIIYELHVRGFTIGRNAHVAAPGTFRGLIEKIPYLSWLGITAVELLPVFEFDECDCPFKDPDTGAKHTNFWGYNPIGFAAPKAAFAASGATHGQDDEFRDMVKAFHEAGIEVYLDVVFNHSGEGDDRGRTYHFRGFDNDLYYLLDDEGRYLNYSGVGNTMNCNHPIVRELIVTCLRYWVTDMHVDGFRFDLASVLGRDRRGKVMTNAPAIEMIADDGILASTKLIAEPWDAGGAYQVGQFAAGNRWAEWNDRYRDDVRKFWKGDFGLTALMASRVCGSADIFGPVGGTPGQTINFITCHDGFTLMDLVSYNDKHNGANGEGNRDGHGDNCSWNSGVEGPTTEPAIRALRERRAKSLIATLLLSQGVPMLLAGDEHLRTQKGNNNAWCQDNALSWIDWSLGDANAGFVRFVRELIWLRKRHPVLRRNTFLKGTITPLTSDIRWHGTSPDLPDFSPESQLLVYTLDGRFHGRDDLEPVGPDNDFLVAMNGSATSETIAVPKAPTGRRWRQLIDTAAASPDDFSPENLGAVVPSGAPLSVAGFGLVVLLSES